MAFERQILHGKAHDIQLSTLSMYTKDTCVGKRLSSGYRVEQDCFLTSPLIENAKSKNGMRKVKVCLKDFSVLMSKSRWTNIIWKSKNARCFQNMKNCHFI